MKNTFMKICAAVLVLLVVNTATAETVWIDVRSLEEFVKDHIDGDTNIPLAELTAAKLSEQYGKDAELMLYCRSGNRAGQAKALLETAGFSNVTNAGSIDEVRSLRGLKESARQSTSPQ